MINKKLLATLIAATFAAPVAVYAEGDGPTVYGRLHLGVQHTDTDSGGGSLDVTSNSSRFGIKGDTDLGNGLNVFYRYEFQVDADNENRIDVDNANANDNKADGILNNRLAYVGVEIGDSKISLGRQWSAMFNHVGTFMDISQALGTSGTTYRLSNDLQYSVTAGAVNIQADIILDGDDKRSDGVDMFQVAGTGNFGPFSIGVGIEHTAENDDASQKLTPESDQVGFGAGVTFGNYFVKGGYVSKEFDGDAIEDATTTVANFGGTFDSGMSFFIQAGEEEKDNSAGTHFENEFFIGQVRKDLGGGTQIYVEARSDNDYNGEDDARTQVVVAMRKDF